MKKIIALVSLVSVFALTGCGGKTLKCSMTDSSMGMDMKSTVDISFDGDKISKLTATVDVTVPDEYKDQKSQLVETFKSNAEEGMKVSETKDGVRLTMTGDESYLSELGIDDEKVSYDDLKKALADEGYTCK